MGITKPYTNLNPALCNTLSVIRTKISHFNWAISPIPGRKFQICPFWLNIGTHDIMEVLIPHPDLDFWNSDPKIHFWAKLGRKSQSCPFCLKTGTYGVSSMLIVIPTLVFWVCNPKSTFGSKNSKLSVLLENWHTWYLWRADSESGLRFSKFWP